MFGLPGLSVETRRRTSRGEVGVFGDIETAVDMAGEIRPVDIGRRRRDRAVDDRRQGAAIAGERSPEIGDQRVALPVGDGEEFRRDHPERRSLRHGGAAGIGVVAAAEFDRGLDQKAAGVIADRAERIVIDLEPLARRLAVDRAGHRRRQRRLVGGFRRRNRQPQRRVRCRRQTAAAAGTGRRLRLGLARIEFRLLARAIERVEAGSRLRRWRREGRRSESGRSATAPACPCRGACRRRSDRPVAVAVLSPVWRSGKSCGDTKPSRTGRNRSGVSVWACAGVSSNAISARHGKARARSLRACGGPLLDPTSR